jgi:methylenetetrahydrofolate--tRNA-(uracil-5-)-methyltransferase
MLGALYRYLRETEPSRFQPMNANFGLLEPLENPPRDKFKRKEALAERALAEMRKFAASLGSHAQAWAQQDTTPRGSDSLGPPFRVGTP